MAYWGESEQSPRTGVRAHRLDGTGILESHWAGRLGDSPSWFQLAAERPFRGTGPPHHWQEQPQDEHNVCQRPNRGVLYYLLGYRLSPSQMWAPQLAVKHEANISQFRGDATRGWCCPSLLRLLGSLRSCEQHETKNRFPILTAWFPAWLPKNRGYGAPKVQWRSEREDTWPSALASGCVAWQNWATSAHEVMGEECA